MSNFQERTFLLLVDETDENKLVKQILQSPLGLAKDLIQWIFNKKLQKHKNGLDKIKAFAAGIDRTESLSSGYTLAKYYSYMFAFQQFFHSSFRARQGKVLEEMIKNVLQIYANCDNVPEKVADSQNILSQSFGGNTITHDIDVMGVNNHTKKILIVQLRSRDDTGGTTAKGSLVELLRTLLRFGVTPQHEITYLICVWDERNSQQKNSTIEKMHLSLKDFAPNKEDFVKKISEGYSFSKKIKLKLAYGTEEISQAFFKWIGTDKTEVLKAIQTLSENIANWDDLWLAYSIADIELELDIKATSNIELLNEKWDKLGLVFDFSSYKSLVGSIDYATNIIAPNWQEDSIPFSSLSDKLHYIRDLLFLKACYTKINS